MDRFWVKVGIYSEQTKQLLDSFEVSDLGERPSSCGRAPGIAVWVNGTPRQNASKQIQNATLRPT